VKLCPALILGLACIFAFFPNAQGATLRVLPLGDSITQSNNTHLSYRYPLWEKFVDANMSVDFIGSLNVNYGGNLVFPAYGGKVFDPDHEGHWGWTVDALLNGMNTWLPNYTPDVVLLNAGTNDLRLGHSVASTVNELKQVISKIRGKNPNVKVLLSNLTPKTNPESNIREKPLNDQIPGIASSMTSAQSPVIFVDLASSFNASTDTFDGVHPNASGEEKMAQRWFAALSSNTQTNAANFISQSVPASMTVGQSYSVSVTMKNSGTSTWTAATGYKLGSQNPQDNTRS